MITEHSTGHEAGAITGISVVVPHYGEPAQTQELVRQLHAQVDIGVPLQIIVSDDLSPVPFPPMRGVTVVRRENNGGFGAAVNSGVEAAEHSHLLILNSDLQLDTDFVSRLCTAAQPWQPAVCAPMLVGLDGETQWGGRRFPRNRHHIIEWLTPLARFRPRLHEAVGHDTRCVEGVTLPVDWLVGAALLIPTDAFRSVGGFDEAYFMNVEEVDLQRQLRARGIPSVFLGDVQVRHEGGGSSDSARRVRWVVQARLRYARKWNENPRALRLGLRTASAVNLVFNSARRLRGRDVQPLAIWHRELSAIRPTEPAS
ncbi:glycosyltransferase family 2 protein [Microbacterium esteraromaticum]|uniref:glycosyltransferase family 2 protein n=1 Tax=Microbacterium esteraromaticum TaxID=57043 RepID=UPI002367659A|nr:glycosyltransferase family 2 protein [Microbacterium esteraromaticum]WDH79445.1 glycosyltransferase family 2 protein [Microbacterium esteraromaticum]